MKVEFAYPYTGTDGKKYKADDVADLPEGVAADLIAAGEARPAKAEKPAPSKTKEA